MRVTVDSKPRNGPSELDLLFTPLVADVWNGQRRRVTPEHMLLHLMRDPDVAAHLAAHGVAITELTARLTEFVAALPQSSSDAHVPEPITEDVVTIIRTSIHRVLMQRREAEPTKFDVLDGLLDESLGLQVTRWICAAVPATALDSLRGVSGRSCALCHGLAPQGSSTVVPYRGTLCPECMAAIRAADAK